MVCKGSSRARRRAAERLGVPLWRYVDHSYLIRAEYQLADWVPPEAEAMTVQVSPAGLRAWQDGFAGHRSQVPFLWSDEAEARAAIERYRQSGYGGTLWRF